MVCIDIFKLTDFSDVDCGCTVNIWACIAEGMTKWIVGVETIGLGWDGQELLKSTLTLKPMYHISCSIGSLATVAYRSADDFVGKVNSTYVSKYVEKKNTNSPFTLCWWV